MSARSLEDLRFVAAADVYKAGRIAGKLQRTDTGSVEFHYSAGYEGAPVASTLPIDGTTHRSAEAERVVKVLVSLVKAKPVAVRNLYLQFVFAWLTGNFAVSPVYDIPCTLLYRDETMALPIAGRTSRIRARHWAEFADTIGLPQNAARSANEVALKAAGFADLSSLPLEGSPLNGAQRELRHRRSQLDG